MTSAPINRKVVVCCRTTGSPLLFTASNRTLELLGTWQGPIYRRALAASRRCL